MTLQSPQQGCKFTGMGLLGVNAVHQCVFKNDTPACLLHIVLAGIQDFSYGISLRDGHRLPPDRIVRCMQRYA